MSAAIALRGKEEQAMSLRICPACGKEMRTARRGDLELDACTACGSLWFDSGKFETAVRCGPEVLRSLCDRLQPVLTGPAGQGSGACPVCQETLARADSRQLPGVKVNACRSCH